jgi:hypothetical protein
MFALLVLASLVLTRVPLAAKYLSIDNVNLALALDKFDPSIHQPQPPGYPFFVLSARAVNLVFHDAEKTFLFASVLVSALCLGVTYFLGRRLFNEWTGKAAVLLLLVNPVFWHTGLDGPLRPNLGLFSLLTAYCAWRSWNGERNFVGWGALALGIGSGFRPDLLAYLGPLWLVSAWAGKHPANVIVRGGIVLSSCVVLWIVSIVYAVGGIGPTIELLRQYSVEQSQGDSVVLGASLRGWLRQVSRLVLWNGLAVIGWVWAKPFYLFAKDRVPLFGRETVFLLVWLVPGWIVQALVHVAAPGHTMFSIPALCIAGAYVLTKGLERWRAAEPALSLAMATNILLFMNVLPLPAAGSTGGLYDAAAVRTFETSLEGIRWIDDIHGTSINEIRDLISTSKGNVVLLAQDVQLQEWFLNWRIARFYFPDLDIRVLADQKKPLEVHRARGSDFKLAGSGDLVEIPVPQQSRILWLAGPDTPLRKAIDATPAIQTRTRVLYADLTAGAKPFQVNGFLITPTDAP